MSIVLVVWELKPRRDYRFFELVPPFFVSKTDESRKWGRTFGEG